MAMTLNEVVSAPNYNEVFSSSSGLSERNFNISTFKGQKLKKGFFGGSHLSLSRYFKIANDFFNLFKSELTF